MSFKIKYAAIWVIAFWVIGAVIEVIPGMFASNFRRDFTLNILVISLYFGILSRIPMYSLHCLITIAFVNFVKHRMTSRSVWFTTICVSFVISIVELMLFFMGDINHFYRLVDYYPNVPLSSEKFHSWLDLILHYLRFNPHILIIPIFNVLFTVVFLKKEYRLK